MNHKVDLNKLTLVEVRELQRDCERHMQIWFGFSLEGRVGMTPEFEAATAWRLQGQTEPCCECGEDYPRADLHFHRQIYCESCRGKK